MASSFNDGKNVVPNAAPILVPPPFKPTSRARTYRIPNTSDAAASAGTMLAVSNSNSGINSENNNNGPINSSSNNGAAAAPPESFLWATREIAALDFLMKTSVFQRELTYIIGNSESFEQWPRQTAPCAFWPFW